MTPRPLRTSRAVRGGAIATALLAATAVLTAHAVTAPPPPAPAAVPVADGRSEAAYVAADRISRSLERVPLEAIFEPFLDKRGMAQARQLALSERQREADAAAAAQVAAAQAAADALAAQQAADALAAQQAADALAAQQAADAAAAKQAAAKKAKRAPAAASGAGSSGSAPTSAPAPAGDAQAEGARQVAAQGWGDGEFGCLVNLWNRESHWNSQARNSSSGAYGIPQAMPGNKMASAGDDWQTNPATQIRWGLGYIIARYGTPCGAWSHSQATGWY